MVEHAECLGICDAAPVVQINYEMYGPVTHDEAMDLLAKAKAGDPPASNRSGEVPPVFTAVERELSGIDDGVHDHLVEAARLQATSDVPPSYRTGETDIPVTHPGGDPAGHGGQAFAAAAGFDGRHRRTPPPPTPRAPRRDAPGRRGHRAARTPPQPPRPATRPPTTRAATSPTSSPTRRPRPAGRAGAAPSARWTTRPATRRRRPAPASRPTLPSRRTDSTPTTTTEDGQ